ncbi:MAG TPA: protein kinase [Candidatus Polarisedimenticolaceae bacterium]|nr:protein kinase [Candidatus Polarisedimenticolaceae bacterium]
MNPSGSSLLHYRIGEKLGVGGMGEVWKATDTTLGREVAIKILPDAFAADPERLARFEREAKVLAALNHPSIATVYGFHEAGGKRFLAMELVPGEDLSARIARGRIPVHDAIEIARHVAEALEAAHEQGIIHRDLKPANVKLTPEGRVKVLDFGLAKALDPAGSSSPGRSDTGMSPTITSLGTVAGVILGTAAYMSPEQARGRSVDKRADTWAFGVLLYEMLTGKRPFDGDTVSDTLASVLKTDPDWSALPSDTPTSVRTLLRRCLAKNPKQRLRSTGDALFELEGEAKEEKGTVPSSPWRSRVPWLVAAALGALLIFTLWNRNGTVAKVPGRSVHIEYPFVTDSGVGLAPPMISPDGNMIVYGSRSANNQLELYLRRIDSFEAKVLPETKDAIFPFWSPDSRSVGYFSSGSLRRIAVESEATQTITEESAWGRGGSWHANGKILFVPNPNSPIMCVDAAGGKPVAVTKLDTSLADASHRFPQWLPDGKRFLYTLWSNNQDVLKSHGGIYVGSTDPGFQERKLLGDPSAGVFAPPDHLLIHRRGRLLSLPFDVAALTVSENAVAIDSGVTFAPSSGTLAASASEHGDFAYAIGSGEPDTEIVWLDRTGQTHVALNQSGTFSSLAVAPDGDRFAVARSEGMTGQQIWIGDTKRATMMPLTHSSNDSFAPVWSPDGAKVAFSSRETGNEDIYVQEAGGTRPWEVVHDARDHDTDVTDWSKDGRYILFDAHPRASTARSEIWLLEVATKTARSVLSDTFTQYGGTLSPDGRWLAYTSEEAGSPQVVIRNFPALDRKWLVTGKLMEAPHWRADGKELLAVQRDDAGAHLMSVPLSPDASGPNPGAPRELFLLDPRISQLAPNADHSRLLVLRDVKATGRNAIRVILK